MYRDRVRSINEENFIEQTTMLQSRLSKSGPKQRLSLSQASLLGMNSYSSFLFGLVGLQSQDAALCGYIFTAIETVVDYVEVNSTRAREEVFEQALSFMDACSQSIGGVIVLSREVVYTDQMRSTAIQNYGRLINFLIELTLCTGNVLGAFNHVNLISLDQGSLTSIQTIPTVQNGKRSEPFTNSFSTTLAKHSRKSQSVRLFFNRVLHRLSTPK